MMNKYGIQIKNLYNFNKIDFIIDVITVSIVITRLNRYEKVKFIQSNNRK